MLQVSMQKVKVKHFEEEFEIGNLDFSADFSTSNDVIISSDNLEEKLDIALEGLRHKE